MPASKTYALLKISLLAGIGSFFLVVVWVSIMFFLATHGSHAPAKAILNELLTGLAVVVFLPALHRGLLRTFWRNEDRSEQGLPFIEGSYLDGNQPLPPAVPKTASTLAQKLLYVACYVSGVAVLLWIYLPLAHMDTLLRFVSKHSGGSASAGSLLEFILAYLPMVVLLLPLMGVLEGERRAIASGRYPAQETLRRKLKQNWLLSFVAALIGTSMLCYLVSSLVLAYL